MLYFALVGGKNILMCDLARHQMSVIDIDTPRVFLDTVMTKTEDGELGFIAMSPDNYIYLWKWQAAHDDNANGGNGSWAQHMAIELSTLLPKPRYCAYSRQLVGAAEGTETVFINRKHVGSDSLR
ncbi:hypothetical protein U9M48_017101 [Paspalum notatum var. saurae]|uniref:Uncharacterized protein n=1 Tax=Paspalum notatum var. saurae TaxID=547442 RepID=A0AAQ3T8L4_PASNO